MKIETIADLKVILQKYLEETPIVICCNDSYGEFILEEKDIEYIDGVLYIEV